MDELDEIRKRKMEKMMSEMNRPAQPSVELPAKPVVVSDARIDAAVSQYPLFILDCWAEWCGPCRMIAPVIEQLAGEMKGKAVFGKLNVDENMQTANKYRISAIPTIMVFKDGKLVDRIIGAYPKPALVAKISKFL
ncbi:MAG TPA: thioredoxin [Methanothrix sp.]|nr:thioredoxin [Methanothrix sp.]